MSRALWWGYFALQALVFIVSLAIGPISIRDVALTVFFAFGLVALWGHLRQLAIGPRWFWRGYFWAVMCAALVGTVFALVEAAKHDASFYLPLLFVAIVFTLPQWWALWRYAFRNPQAWRSVAAASGA